MEVFDERDEILVRYLLNELSKEENEELEDEMVLKPEFSERAQAIETSLTESYVLGEMSAAEKAHFVNGYLIFPDNREKVEDARAFHKALHIRRQERPEATKTKKHEHARRGWLASLLRMPVPAMAFAALVLIVAVVAGLLLIDRLRSNQVASDNHNSQENARQQVVSRPEGNRDDNSTRDAPEETTNAPTNNAMDRRLPSNQEVAKLNAAPPGRVVVSIVENSGRIGASLRGPVDEVKVQPVRIPASAKSFTLRMSLEPNEYFKDTRNCSVDISNIKFTRLYPSANYQKVTAKPVAGKFQVSLDVPTAYLKDGDIYYLRVSETNSLTPFKVKFTR